MPCQQRVLGLRWYHFITITKITSTAVLDPTEEDGIISRTPDKAQLCSVISVHLNKFHPGHAV